MRERRDFVSPQSLAIPGGWQRYEVLLCVLSMGVTVSLATRAGVFDTLTIQAAIISVIFVGATETLRRQEGGEFPLRLLVGYSLVLWFYLSVALFVRALGLQPRDDFLLVIDEYLFSVTPAVRLQSISSNWLTEGLSCCYLFYLVYVHVAVGQALLMPAQYTRRFANWVLSVFAIGLPCYLLVPAVGPAKAFPQLFTIPLEGGLFTSVNHWVVEHGSSVYDAFPSLHVLVTCALLEFDRRWCPCRFRIMLAPALGIAFSTIYLRYHYAVDLVASLVILLFALVFFRSQETIHVAPRIELAN